MLKSLRNLLLGRPESETSKIVAPTEAEVIRRIAPGGEPGGGESGGGAPEAEVAVEVAAETVPTTWAEPVADADPNPEPAAASDAAPVEAVDPDAPIPMLWRPMAARRAFPVALAPLVIAAMSGRRVRHARFDGAEERLLAGGAFPKGLQGGIVHVWGGGLSVKHATPADEDLRFHAVRGPMTAAAMTEAGYFAPAVFGAPLWFAPRLFDLAEVERTVEIALLRPPRIGKQAPAAGPDPQEEIPDTLRDFVTVIDLETEPSFDAWSAKAREIAGCKRILNAAPAMAPFLEALALPNLSVVNGARRAVTRATQDPESGLPIELADLYAGFGLDKLTVYRTPARREIDWAHAIEAIDAHWRPVDYDPRPFFDAAPFDVVVDLNEARWPCAATLSEASKPAAASAETEVETEIEADESASSAENAELEAADSVAPETEASLAR